MSDKNILKREQKSQKTFHYELEGLVFNFTCRVDVGVELRAGIEIANQLAKDLETELSLVLNKK